MEEVTYTVHIEPAEEGGFVAHFPALPGCYTQGETMDEVIAMAKDALVGFLETLRERGQPISREATPSKHVSFEFPLSTSVTHTAPDAFRTQTHLSAGTGGLHSQWAKRKPFLFVASGSQGHDVCAYARR